MKIEKRMVKPIPTEYETEVFIANDGTEFDTEYECKKYEEKQESLKKLKAIEKYKIIFEGIPLDDGACYTDYRTYRWYKVNNEVELDEICDVFDVVAHIKKYPSYVCIDTEDDDDVEDAYAVTLEAIMKTAKNFFKCFGMEVEFK